MKGDHNSSSCAASIVPVGEALAERRLLVIEVEVGRGGNIIKKGRGCCNKGGDV